MLHAMLRTEGLDVNAKKTYRIYREEALQVRRKARKRQLARDRIPMPRLGTCNQCWSMDFISDQLATGRRFRVLNVVDHYSRECVGQIVDYSISGKRVSQWLDQLAVTRGRPESIVMDNGPEFTSKAMLVWSQRTGVELRFIQPGKPTQNAFVESFNGKFRDACLNSHWFVDINDARRSIETWRVHYNTVRPHSSLGFLSPEQFRMAGETGCGKDGRSATLDLILGEGHLDTHRNSGLNNRRAFVLERTEAPLSKRVSRSYGLVSWITPFLPPWSTDRGVLEDFPSPFR